MPSSESSVNMSSPSGTNETSMAENDVRLELVEHCAELPLFVLVFLKAPVVDNVGKHVREKVVEFRREVAKDVRAAGVEEVLAFGAKLIVLLMLLLILYIEDAIPFRAGFAVHMVRRRNVNIHMNSIGLLVLALELKNKVHPALLSSMCNPTTISNNSRTHASPSSCSPTTSRTITYYIVPVFRSQCKLWSDVKLKLVPKEAHKSITNPIVAVVVEGALPASQGMVAMRRWLNEEAGCVSTSVYAAAPNDRIMIALLFRSREWSRKPKPFLNDDVRRVEPKTKHEPRTATKATYKGRDVVEENARVFRTCK